MSDETKSESANCAPNRNVDTTQTDLKVQACDPNISAIKSADKLASRKEELAQPLVDRSYQTRSAQHFHPKHRHQDRASLGQASGAAYKRHRSSLSSSLEDISAASQKLEVRNLEKQQNGYSASSFKQIPPGAVRSGKTTSSGKIKLDHKELLMNNSIESISSKLSSVSSSSTEKQPSGEGGGGQRSSSSCSSPGDTRQASAAYMTIATRAVAPPKLDANRAQWYLEGSQRALYVGPTSKEHQFILMMTPSEPVPGEPLSLDTSAWTLAKKAVGQPTGLGGDPSKGNKIVSSGKRSKSGATQSNPHELKAPFMFAGVLGALMSSIFFSSSLLCLKLLPQNEGIQGKLKGVLFRGFVISCLCGISILVSKSTIKISRDELWVNVMRCVFGSTALLCSYTSLEYISMGDSTALIFSSPIWTYILGHFVLKEPLHWILIIALPASMLGIVLIAHPSLILNMDHLSILHHLDGGTRQNQTTLDLIHENLTTDELGPGHLLGTFGSQNDELDMLYEEQLNHRWPGIVIALVGSIFVTFSFIAMKFRKKTPIQTTTFYFGLTMIVVASIPLAVMGGSELPVTTGEWLLLLGNGTLSWLGQCCLQWSTQYEKAGILSILRTLDVALSFILSAIFLDEDIYLTSIIGSVIISAVIVTMMLQSWLHGSKAICTRKQQPDLTANDARGGPKPTQTI